MSSGLHRLSVIIAVVTLNFLVSVTHGQGIGSPKPPISTSQGMPSSSNKPPLLGTSAQMPPEIAKAAKRFNDAIAAQQAGKLDAALAAYRDVVKVTPNAYPAWFNMGLVQEGLNKFPDASASYKKAGILDPKNPNPHVQLAILYVRMKKYPEAKVEAQKGVDLNPKMANAHYALGGANAGTNNGPEAIKEFKEASNLSPKNAQYRFSLGYSYASQNRFDEAITAFKEATKLAPKFTQSWMYLGVLQQKKQDYTAAIASYKKVSEINPGDAAAHYNTGICYQLMGENRKDAQGLQFTQNALNEYLKALDLAPKYNPAHVNSARLYFKTGNYLEASRQFAIVLADSPKVPQLQADTAVSEMWYSLTANDKSVRKEYSMKAEQRFLNGIKSNPAPPLFIGLGFMYEQQGRLDLAGDIYQKWAAFSPKEAAPLLALAKLRETQKKSAEAIALYEKALVVDPKNSAARAAYAASLESSNNLEGAVKQYRSLVQDNAKNLEAHRKLGQLLMRQGKVADAVAEFNVMKVLSPKDSTPYIAAGAAFEREKKYDEAVKEYRALSAMNDKDPTPHWYIAKVLETQKKYDDAITEYRTIEKLVPKDNFYSGNIPRILELAGKSDDALAEYKRVAASDPKNSQSAVALAMAYEKRNKLDEAVSEYQRALELAPNAGFLYLRLGDLFVKQNRHDDARLAYSRVLDKQGESIEAYQKIENSFTVEMKLPALYEFLKGRIRLDPSDRIPLSRIEAVAKSVDKQADMLAFLKETAAKGVKQVGFYMDYGAILQRAGKQDDAIGVYKQAGVLSPGDYTVHTTIASLAEQLGRIPEAISAWEAVVGNPNVVSAQMIGYRTKLASLYEKNGQSAGAIKQYREIVKMDPTNKIAVEALKRLGG